jgi:hypothetical protein
LAEPTLGDSPIAMPQAPANAEQTVVAGTNATADQTKTHKTGTDVGSVEVGFVRIQFEPQASEVFLKNGQRLLQRLRLIGEQG